MPIVREIKYDGFVFRSKIEAQWYVFFTSLGLEVHYESETFALQTSDNRTVNYLPDFYLPDLDCFVEIKLEKNPLPIECHKCFLLAQQTKKNVFLFYQTIGTKMNGYKYFGESGAFLPLNRFAECPTCGFFDICYQGRLSAMRCKCNPRSKLTNSASHAIQEAIVKVRSERFGA